MRVQVKKWGNSASIRIPASVMAAASLRIDQEVDVREDDGRVVIEPVTTPSYDLDALLVRMTPDTVHDEIDFGGPVGAGDLVTPPYVPDSGDIVWLAFDPQAGHEQAGHRPALVLSPARYNGPRGMMLCCPMTSRIKGYPFEVVDSSNPPSVVLADQIKSLDWRARGAKPKGRVSAATLAKVRAKLRVLLDP